MEPVMNIEAEHNTYNDDPKQIKDEGQMAPGSPVRVTPTHQTIISKHINQINHLSLNHQSQPQQPHESQP